MLWAGRPDSGVLFGRGDLLLVPFTVLWGGFAVFWNVMAWRGHAPVFFRLWGIPFLLAGLYVIVGRFFVKTEPEATAGVRADQYSRRDLRQSWRSAGCAAGSRSDRAEPIPGRSPYDGDIRDLIERLGRRVRGRTPPGQLGPGCVRLQLCHSGLRRRRRCGGLASRTRPHRPWLINHPRSGPNDHAQRALVRSLIVTGRRSACGTINR